MRVATEQDDETFEQGATFVSRTRSRAPFDGSDGIYDRGRVPFETRNTEVRGSELPTLERRSGLKRQNNNKKEMEEQTKARREGRELISVADGYVFSWVDL